MKHEDRLVDVLDTQGHVVGQKVRRDIDKKVDIFNSVHLVLITPDGELVVSTIPQRDELPNLYADMLGTTVATIRRSGETKEQAARRALKRELLIVGGELRLLRDGMVTMVDGRRHCLTAYLVQADLPALYRRTNTGELSTITPEGIDLAMGMHPDRFAPTFRAIWPAIRSLA